MTLVDTTQARADAKVTEVVLGPLAELPTGEGRAYDAAGIQIAVFHTRAGSVHAVSAACTHAGGPIADGQADNVVVLCPLHLNVFELATGCSRSGQPPLQSYPVHVDAEGRLVAQIACA